MPAPSWKDYDERRQNLPKPLSRAQMARRAGLSESTVAKGIRHGRTPRKAVRERLELVLDAALKMAEAGL